jgi:hypothetical protein
VATTRSPCCTVKLALNGATHDTSTWQTGWMGPRTTDPTSPVSLGAVGAPQPTVQQNKANVNRDPLRMGVNFYEEFSFHLCSASGTNAKPPSLPFARSHPPGLFARCKERLAPTPRTRSQLTVSDSPAASSLQLNLPGGVEQLQHGGRYDARLFSRQKVSRARDDLAGDKRGKRRALGGRVRRRRSDGVVSPIQHD